MRASGTAVLPESQPRGSSKIPNQLFTVVAWPVNIAGLGIAWMMIRSEHESLRMFTPCDALAAFSAVATIAMLGNIATLAVAQFMPHVRARVRREPLYFLWGCVIGVAIAFGGLAIWRDPTALADLYRAGHSFTLFFPIAVIVLVSDAVILVRHAFRLR